MMNPVAERSQLNSIAALFPVVICHAHYAAQLVVRDTMLPRIAKEIDEGHALKCVNRTPRRVGEQRNLLLLQLRRIDAVHAEAIDRGGKASKLVVA